MKWEELQNILYDNPHIKIPEFTQLQDEMEIFFSEMLRKLKEEHVKFKIWSRTYGYSEELMNFIHLINEGNFNQISGVYMNQILEQIFMKEQKPLMYNFDLGEIPKVQNEINSVLEKLTKVYNPRSAKQQDLNTSKQFKLVHQDLLDSKITSQFDYIQSLFTKLKPKSYKLLYRASENEFSVGEFHKKCDTIPNTLLLVKTEYSKVIGGFTPLPWNSSKKHWAADKSSSSFIFSLDMRERFQLNLMQFAVACNPQKGPIFGCCDICIVDKSNVQKCNAEFPISYNNFKYSRNSETSIAFTGSSKGKFYTKQWEVFQVQFNE